VEYLTKILLIASAFALAGGCAQMSPRDPKTDLGGTSWQLVKFQGGDDRVLVPDDPAKYTIAFGADGSVSARIDCNRGRGAWKSEGPGKLEFGPMAVTRAMCPPGSLHDHIIKQWHTIRSYVIRDGRLYLSLMADGGIYEYEPFKSK
jgi:para-nitrobenzyl esterase